MGLIKIKNFCSSKGTIMKMKSRVQNGRKCKMYIWFMFRIYREFLALNNKKTQLKMGKRC